MANDIYKVNDNGKKIYTSAQKAIAKYEEKNYDKVLVRLPKGTADEIREVVGKAPATFLKDCGIKELTKAKKKADAK